MLDEETRLGIDHAVCGENYWPVRWYSEDSRSGLDGARYYGRYGYHDIWCLATDQHGEKNTVIDGVDFTGNCGFFLIGYSVLGNSAVERIYELGMLSREDLEAIAAVHRTYEERIAKIKANWDTEAGLEDAGEIVLPVVREYQAGAGAGL